MTIPRFPSFLVLLAFAVPGPAVAGQELVLHVEQAASAGGDGSAARPFRHPEEALAALHARQAEDAPPRPITILLGEGTWTIEQSLRFDDAACGGDGSPTTLRGTGERTRLLGGRVLPPATLQQVTDPAVLARLPNDEARATVRVVDLAALGIGELGHLAARGMGSAVTPVPSELFVGGQPLVPARWPNDGFAPVGRVLDPGSVPRQRAEDVPLAERETGPPRGGVFAFDHERVRRWSTAPAAWVGGYWHWDWADELLPVARFDVEKGEVHLGLPHRYGLRDGGRFYVTNLLEELDAPGEYHIDLGARRLYVRPPEATPQGEVVLSLLAEPVLVIEDCHHLTVSDLVIEGTRGMGVRVVGGEGVVLERCTLRNLGTHGIEVSGRHQTVRRCTLEGIGATGIVLRGGDRATLTAAANVVEDCEIRRFGRTWRTYQPAVSISGVGNVVRHNHLHHAPHFAISFSGNEHVIEGNRIHDVLLETGDAGAIYTGRDWTLHGNAIRHNLIHDIPGTADRWQNAVYLDDMASGITVEGNLFFRCNLGMLVGGGRHLTIRHNLFLDCALGLRFDARGVGWMASYIADPATSTLHQRLRDIPVDRPPWSERYPEVRDTLTVAFGRPLGSAVVENVFARTPFGSVDDREMVRVADNLLTDDVPGLFRIPPGPDDRTFTFASPTWAPPGLEGFPPLPVGTFGIRAESDVPRDG